MRRGKARYPHSSYSFNAAWQSVAQHGAVWPGAVRLGEARYPHLSFLFNTAGIGVAGNGEAWLSMAWHGKARGLMPKKRQPKEIWADTRRRVLIRDEFRCRRCSAAVCEKSAHIDHIVSGKRGTNAMSNLRALCRRCHVLRADMRHRGMIAKALADEIIPPNWRELVWDG